MTDRHPERSEAESKVPVELLFGFAPGFLDFARNDSQIIRHFSFGLPSTFVIRGSSFPPHLPVFDEIIWNFLQKTGRPLEYIAVAATQTHVRVGEIKLVARARDGYVKQAAFFLQRIARIERAAAGEHAVSQPNHEDGMKLET